MIQKFHARRINDGKILDEDVSLVMEEPLQIVIQGKPYTIIMRLPGDEIPLAAGFCLTDGIIDGMDDLAGLNFCKDTQNKILISLSEARLSMVHDHLNRKGFISQSSCGLCGKELLNEICTNFPSVQMAKTQNIPLKKLFDYAQILKEQQKLFVETGAVHATAIFDGQERLIAFAEDVGRHNALDKAIGKAFLNQTLKYAKVAVCSSRASFEMVQKVARAKIPFLATVSAPTHLGVELAQQTNVCLVGFVRQPNATVYTFPERIQ